MDWLEKPLNVNLQGMDRYIFLYNRVEDIERKAEEISMLVPDARVSSCSWENGRK